MRQLAALSPFSVVAFAFLALASFAIPVFAQSDAPKVSRMPIGKPVELKAPLGLPPVPIPADNPLTEETIALGRRLTTILCYRSTAQSPALPAMLRNSRFRTIARFLKA